MTRGPKCVGLWCSLGAVVLVMAGCTGEEPAPSPPGPVVTATPEVTPSVEPTSAPTAAVVLPPARPAEMDLTDDVGAAAAGKYFLQLFAYVLATGDLEEWDRVTTAECTMCTNTRERVGLMVTSGSHVTGGGVTVGVPEVLERDEVIGGFAVGVPYRFEEGAEVSVDGTVIRSMEREDGYAVLDVIPSIDGWVLVEGSNGSEALG